MPQYKINYVNLPASVCLIIDVASGTFSEALGATEKQAKVKMKITVKISKTRNRPTHAVLGIPDLDASTLIASKAFIHGGSIVAFTSAKVSTEILPRERDVTLKIHLLGKYYPPWKGSANQLWSVISFASHPLFQVSNLIRFAVSL